MKELKQSIVVDFGASLLDADGILKAELYDDVNPSKPFKLTDAVNFLVFKSDNVFYNFPLASTGFVESQGSVTLDKEETILVTDNSPVSLGYPLDGVAEFSWYGPAPDIVKDGDGAYIFTGTYPFIGKVNYSTKADNYLLTPPVLSDDIIVWAILILIIGGINAS